MLDIDDECATYDDFSQWPDTQEMLDGESDVTREMPPPPNGGALSDARTAWSASQQIVRAAADTFLNTRQTSPAVDTSNMFSALSQDRSKEWTETNGNGPTNLQCGIVKIRLPDTRTPDSAFECDMLN